MSELRIRPAVADDLASLRELVVDLAIYEKEPDAVKASEDDFRKALFCESPKVFALICENVEDEKAAVIGLAIYFFNFSTWIGKHGIYLEDLFVKPEARGLGAGKALLKAVGQIALENDCGRYEWSVLDWNTPAIDFYKAQGAVPMDEWTVFRMDREAIEAFVPKD